jgi:hypothetical protein
MQQAAKQPEPPKPIHKVFPSSFLLSRARQARPPNSCAMGHESRCVQAGAQPRNTRSAGNADSHSNLRLRERLKPFLPYLDRPEGNTGEGAGELSTPDDGWINLDVIRGWLEACQRRHGHQCQLVKHNPGSSTCSPAWLIDVEHLCLVRGQPEMRYFALSYVWGTSESACTESATLGILQERGALGQAVQMPKTVAHTVQLAKLLGERYLWVDRFCIVQDGGLEKQAQLDGMGDIFAGAYATVVAATGTDADHGLTGIPGVTGRRYLLGRSKGGRQHDADVGLPDVGASLSYSVPSSGMVGIDDDIRNVQSLQWSSSPPPEAAAATDDDDDYSIIYYASRESPAPAEHAGEGSAQSDDLAPSEEVKIKSNSEILVEQAHLLMKTTWYSRGWTFQEQMFSGRKIIFQGDTVNWECACAAWHEANCLVVAGDQPQEQQNGERQADPRSNHVSKNAPWPDLHRYVRLVSLYNRRNLTYPEDLIDAFAGVIATFNHNFAGGFISGLPRMFFDSALLWQPHRLLSRRVPRGKQEACLPSWSWVGWHGTLNSESWRSGYDYLRKNADEYYERDMSVWQPASWHTTSTVRWFYLDEARDKHAIDACGHDFRNRWPDSTQPLPQGWTSHTCEESEKPFFRHESDQEQEFWYPIPLRKAADPLIPHVRARYLYCMTRRAVLNVGEAFHNNATGECPCVDLLDGEQNWVGVLRYPFAQLTGAETTYTEHELIELSAGSVLDQETEAVSFEEWDRPGCPRRSGKYEFYNVMAIKRDGPTVFREAVGRVEKAAWERLATERIGVTLG